MRRPAWRTTGLAGACVFVVLTYASFGRPLWIDEFLQFALAGLPPDRALKVLGATTGDGVNHGQTGAYFVLDYLLLKAAGASLVAMRLPSMVCGLVLLLSAVVLVRIKGFSGPWQLLAVAAFAGQATLMYYAGEARPYMILAAISVAMVVYFQYPLDMRGTWLPRSLGIFGVIVGAIGHPYFPLFLALAFGFAAWQVGYTRGRRLASRELMALLNVPLVIAGSALYVGVGLASWMRGSPHFGFDPFELRGGFFETVALFARSHIGMTLPFELLSSTAAVALALVLVIMVTAVAVTHERRRLLPPVTLMGLGILSSLVLVVGSALRSYWVLERQWVGGMSITTAAFVWFLAEAHASMSARAGVWGRVGRLGIVLIVALMVVNAVFAVTFRWGNYLEHRRYWAALAASKGSDELLSDQSRREGETFVEYANRNAAVGGPVWAGVGEYYGG